MKFQLFPPNAYRGEKIAYIMFYLCFVGGFLFLQFSAIGVFKNDYTALCAKAGWAWHTLAFVLAGYVGFALYQWVTDADKKPSFWLIFAAMALSVLSHCGFSF
jgi:hypothetical protein